MSTGYSVGMFRKEDRERDDRIACRDCGDSIPAPEGAALIFALKDACPFCGGELVLLLDQGVEAGVPLGAQAA